MFRITKICFVVEGTFAFHVASVFMDRVCTTRPFHGGA